VCYLSPFLIFPGRKSGVYVRTFAELSGKFSDDALRSLEFAREFLDSLPDRESGIWTCYGISLFFLESYVPDDLNGKLDLVVGFFGGSCKHAWIRGDGFILDLYPVSCASGPFLLLFDGPWKAMYRGDGSVLTERRVKASSREFDELHELLG